MPNKKLYLNNLSQEGSVLKCFRSQKFAAGGLNKITAHEVITSTPII